MVSGPAVLIYSGNEADNAALARALALGFPQVPVMTAHTEADVRKRLPQVEVLFAWSFPVHLLAHADRLRWIQVMGTGVDWVLQGSGPPVPVAVTNVRGIFSSCMAEYALGYMLAHSQSVRRVIRQQALRDWAPFQPDSLAGKTVGVAGLGSIGQGVSRLAAAVGMRVIGLKRHRGIVPHVERVYLTGEIDEFLPQCDYLVLALPHTPETAGLLTRERLQLLKPGCFLVNMGRGTVAGEADLAEALRSGWLAGAALDVFPTEPLPADSPLWGLENVFITPHISGINRVEDLLPALRENLRRYLGGEPLLNQVDLVRGY